MAVFDSGLDGAIGFMNMAAACKPAFIDKRLHFGIEIGQAVFFDLPETKDFDSRTVDNEAAAG